MSTLRLFAAAAVIAAAIFIVGALSNHGGRAAPEPPARIYGRTLPAEARVAATSPVVGDGDGDALRVASRWAAAWGRLTACPASSPRSLQQVLELSGGQLQDALGTRPPRPTAAQAARCRPPVIKHVRVYRTGQGWFAIATRHGDGLRPLRLRLHTTTAGRVRVTAIDF